MNGGEHVLNCIKWYQFLPVSQLVKRIPPPTKKKKLTNDKTDSQIVEILIEKNKVSGNLAFHRGMVSTRDLYNI